MDEMQISMPLTDFVKGIAREAALTVIKEHIESCPVAKDIIDLKSDQKETNREVGKLKIRVATIVGLIFGSAGIGGVSGAGMAKLLGG
jgi:hypothetical protein